MNALPPGHIEEYDRLLEKRVSVVHSLFIIQNDLRLKREKETTVCYEWRPLRRLKLVPCFIKSHKLHTQRLESL